jgi:mannose-1-phosphate guanylyltransferase
MDHLQTGLIVEGRFSWADLGSWDTWARLGQSASRTIAVDSKNINVIGDHGHLVATIGVRDLVIVQTPTATLICHAQKAQAANPRLAPYR